jgi:hypothetical protein
MAEPYITVDPPGLPTWSRDRRIGHYGGATDKENSDTEGIAPYAWGWYSTMQAARPSIYSLQQSGLLHARNVAFARVMAGATRASEKLRTNSLPTTAAEAIGRWVAILGVPQRFGDTLHDLRQRCAAHYQAAKGNSDQLVDEAVAKLLGDSYVRSWRQTGPTLPDGNTDLSSPPTPTFWPVANPGPAGYDLGGGTWLSSRAHLVIETQQLDGQTQRDFLELMNVDLYGLLDLLLPSYATFNWAIGISAGGFFLDISELDFTGMT